VSSWLISREDRLTDISQSVRIEIFKYICITSESDVRLVFVSFLMSTLFGSASTTATQSTTVDISGDLEVPQGPEDSIADISFSPSAEILSVASWDNKVRIYEIGQGGVNGKAMYEHTGPVLSTHFSKDGSKLASGSADKTAKVFDLGSGQNQQVAAHDMPIKSVRFINVNGTEALATASWDKTLKYWDLRRTIFMVWLKYRTNSYCDRHVARKGVLHGHQGESACGRDSRSTSLYYQLEQSDCHLQITSESAQVSDKSRELFYRRQRICRW
jgi:WD40 repeat protein